MRKARCARRLSNDIDRTRDNPVHTEIMYGRNGADLKRCYVQPLEFTGACLSSKVSDLLVKLSID